MPYPPEKWTYPLKRDHFKRKLLFQTLIYQGICLVFWGISTPQPVDASHKLWKFRLGFPILKLECHPGGDWHPGWGGTSKLFFPSSVNRLQNGSFKDHSKWDYIHGCFSQMLKKAIFEKKCIPFLRPIIFSIHGIFKGSITWRCI